MDKKIGSGSRIKWGGWMLMALAVLGGIAYGVLQLPGFGATPSGERRARIEASPQWRDGRLENKQPQWLDIRGALQDAVFGASNPQASPDVPVAVVRTDPATLAVAPASGLRITWFGHSSTLVEVDGVRVLTDPFWGERASPVGFSGPRSWYAPPIALADLPSIDAVVISHDHFDHLDRTTIEAMRGWSTVFVVPLGIGAHLERWGIARERIHELDWWDRKLIRGLAIVATPARHGSGRRTPSSNQTLWAGWALIGPQHRVWFSGDSSFHDDLVAIGARLGPFDITLTDSGQYNEHWPDVHFGPELAVQAHKLVRGKRMIPVHWGRLQLAPHTWTEPVERSLQAAACQNVDMLVLQPGQPTEPSLVPGPGQRWWPEQVWRDARAAPLLPTRAGLTQDRYTAPGCQPPG
jgi:L-ascorbate metabolism protein UlaG (beta-lactamase superfamily)